MPDAASRLPRAEDVYCLRTAGGALVRMLALVAVVWTVELVRIQLQLQEVVQSIRDYLVHLDAGFGGGSASARAERPFC